MEVEVEVDDLTPYLYLVDHGGSCLDETFKNLNNYTVFVGFWIRFYNTFMIDGNCKALKKSVNSLSQKKFTCFVILVKHIWNYIDNVEVGKWVGFFKKNINAYSLFNFALNACDHIKEHITMMTKDCWLYSGTIKDDGYVQVHFHELELSFKPTQGYRYFSLPGGFNKPIFIHKWVCSLLYDGLQYCKTDIQAAHRCRNTSCFSPFHLKKATDVENKNDIGCRFGCAHYCPHEPKCIWTSVNGIWYLCRNNLSEPINKNACEHNPYCFEYH